MKGVLFFFVATLTLTLAVKYSEKEFFDNCFKSCSTPEEHKERIRDLRYEVTPVDQCFLTCAFKKVKNVNANGEPDIKLIEAQFKEAGEEMPLEIYELAKNKRFDDDLVQKVKSIMDKHKVLVKKVYFF